MPTEGRKRSSGELRFGLTLLVPLIIFVSALNAYPLVYSIWLSLLNYDLSTNTVNFIGFGNYDRALHDTYLAKSLLVTLRFTVESTLFSLLLALGISLLLNENFRGRGAMRAMVLLPWSFSTYAVATIFRYLVSDQFGFINSVLTQMGLLSRYITFLSVANAIDWLAIAFSWNFAPLGAFFLIAGLQVIPEDLYRQAKVDGAGPFRRFFYITLPYLRHPILVTLLLTTIAAATETALIIGLTGGGPGVSTQTLTYWIFAQAFQNFSFGYSAAISWLLVLLVLGLGIGYFIVLQPRRRRGV